MVAEKFQIYNVKINANTFVSQKKWICSFLLMPSSKTLSQIVIIIPQADGNCPYLPNSVFWRYFFLSRKKGGVEDYGVEKITKIKKGIGHKFW